MSTKIIGCGGRYSDRIFCPCKLCLSNSPEECKAIRRAFRLTPHEEYWQHTTKKYIIKSHGELL